MARPSKYSPRMIREAKKYIKECEDEFIDVVESRNSKTGRVKFRTQLKVKLPKAEGLALYLGVSRDTLYDWAKQHKKFSYILEKINQMQADRVINEALAGNYNPLIAKLLLGKHGYKEKADLTSGDKELNLLYGLSAELLAELGARVAKKHQNNA